MMDKRQNRIWENSIENRIIRSATIEITTLCNWRCCHCYLGEQNQRGLEKSTILDILEQLRDMGTYEITFTGGEVFAREDIFEILEMARALGFCVNVFSNISLLDKNKIERLAGLSINRISCTIFSMSEDIHDKIVRMPGALEKVLVNLKEIKSHGIPVEVKTCITSLNTYEYKNVLCFCRENGFAFRTNLAVVPVQNHLMKENDCKVEIDDWAKITKELDKIQKKEYQLHEQEEYVCPDIRNSVAIDSRGNIKPCIKYEFTIGNIYNQSIRNVWENNESFRSIQELKWKDQRECTGCEHKAYCFRCPIEEALEEKYNKTGKKACLYAQEKHNIYC